MFNFREYIKKGFLNAVGKMSDYQIILNSAGYLEKGVLTEDDLSEINEAIEKQYIVEEVPEEVIEETPAIEESWAQTIGCSNENLLNASFNKSSKLVVKTVLK